MMVRMVVDVSEVLKIELEAFRDDVYGNGLLGDVKKGKKEKRQSRGKPCFLSFLWQDHLSTTQGFTF